MRPLPAKDRALNRAHALLLRPPWMTLLLASALGAQGSIWLMRRQVGEAIAAALLWVGGMVHAFFAHREARLLVRLAEIEEEQEKVQARGEEAARNLAAFAERYERDAAERARANGGAS